MAAIFILLLRLRLRVERVFRDRHMPLDWMCDDEIYDAFRFRRYELRAICNELGGDVTFDAPKGSWPSIMRATAALIPSNCHLVFLTVG